MSYVLLHPYTIWNILYSIIFGIHSKCHSIRLHHESMRLLQLNLWQVFVFTTLFVLLSLSSEAQQQAIVGRIVDAITHQPVAHAQIILIETGQQKSTDNNGCFRYNYITLENYTLSVRHFLYTEYEGKFTWADSIEIYLQPKIFKSKEVIIFSTRTLSSLSNTPYAAEINSQEKLAQQSYVSIADAVSKIPGISLVRDGAWETALSIRGLSRSSIVSVIDQTRIETAHDIAGALSLININDLERVETIKSSGSVLYGTGALGGILHMISKRASFSDRPELHTEIASCATSVNNGYSNYLALNGSTDRIAMRISGGYRNAGNTKTPGGELPNSQYQDFSVNSTLGLRTVSDQSLFLTYQRAQAENAGIPGSSLFGSSAIVRYTSARRELVGIEYNIPNLIHMMPMLSFRLSRHEITRNVESSQGDSLQITPHAVHTTISTQIESKICPSTRHLIVAGVEAWQRSLESYREKRLLKKNIIVGERPIPVSKFFNAGIYANDEWTLIQNSLTATFGIRYDWISVKNETVFSPEYSITNGKIITNLSDSTILWKRGAVTNESWSATAGIHYVLSPSYEITCLVATAFRAPSLEERYQYLDLGNGNLQVGNPYLQPERSVAGNIGISMHSDKCNVRADMFINNLSNLIKGVQGTFQGHSALVQTNISHALLYGFEMTSETPLSSWSVIKASVAYVRGEDTYTHTNLPMIAPLTWQTELIGYWRSLGTMSILCSSTAEHKQLAPMEKGTPGYTVFDFGYVSDPLLIGSNSLVIRAGIQNLFNASYQHHLSTLRGIIKLEPGRNFYISATIGLQ